MANNITHDLNRLQQELAAMRQDANEITSRADSMERSIDQLKRALATKRATTPNDDAVSGEPPATEA